MRVGVFLGQVLHEDRDRLQAVAKYAANLQEVELVRRLGFRPRLNVRTLAQEIREHRLDRIVLAGDSPGHFKPAFTHAMRLSGGDPREVYLASFREHGADDPHCGGDGGCGANGGSNGNGATARMTERAKEVVACAVQGVPFHLVAAADPSPVQPSTLVIGAGVAGIQAALEIADAGKKVCLVERSETIGGHMAMFDKTFPTLDCAACILTPKMVSVGDHENIELLTNAEVTGVRGGAGAYSVQIVKHPRRVDADACVACGICAQYCAVNVWSEFDSSLTHRKAVYIPFPQAVPNAYVVDPSNCMYVQSGGQKCGACAKKCPKECIHLDEQDETVEVEVGNIIIATGYELFDATRVKQYGYGKLPNVLTSLEFERMTNASGPTGGKIVLKTKKMNRRTKVEEWVADPNGPPPSSVAIIHCVGSRDANYNPYCSRVCCMYSLKFAHLVREKLPDATCYEFYIDMRAFGKGYEEFMERIKSEGTHVIRGRSAEIHEVDGRMVVVGEDVIHYRLVEFPVDLVILAVGVVPSHGTRGLAELLGVPRDSDGWFSELNYNAAPTDTERGGIYVAGMCQGPKDIPDTVAQASAVAAGVLRSIACGCCSGDVGNLKLSEVEARARQMAQKRAGVL